MYQVKENPLKVRPHWNGDKGRGRSIMASSPLNYMEHDGTHIPDLIIQNFFPNKII